MELSCNLYKMLVERVETFKGKTQLVKLILQIVTSALKISQKRKVYQPHFNISIESLLQLCEVVDECCDGRQSPVAQIGLEAVLMSTPPVNILQMVNPLFTPSISYVFVDIKLCIHSCFCCKLNMECALKFEKKCNCVRLDA